MEKLKILVSAYSCRPGAGSEPGVGWNVVVNLAKHCEVWAIVRLKYKSLIESSEEGHGVHWVYYDLPQWMVRLKERLATVYPYYLVWQIGSRKYQKEIIHKEDIDLVHHLTFGTVFLPSLLRIRGIPFVWGPVGGLLSSPISFFHFFSLRARVVEMLRRGFEFVVQFITIPMFFRKGDKVLTVSECSRSRLPGYLRGDAEVVSQVGIAKHEWDALARIEVAQNPENFVVLMTGRFLSWKGFAIGMEVFSRWAKDKSNVQLKMIGNGSEERWLRRYVEKLEGSEKIIFLGALSREEYYEQLSACDVFLFPSLHEPGAFVIIEAMAAAKAVVCFDIGEPGTEVVEGSGIAIKLSSPEQVLRELEEALDRLYFDVEFRQTIGRAARERSALYLWDRRAHDFLRSYKTLG